MKRWIIALTALLGLSAARIEAQDLYAYSDSVKTGYPFLLCLPDGYNPADTTARPPLIVFLHGRSRCGRDLNMVTRYGCIDALRRGQDIPAIIVSPQTTVVGWEASKVMAVVDWVGARFPYDTDRLYVIGMSMGGWGSFKVAAEYPERVAAAIAECGGFTGETVEPLTHVPLWIIHGTADKVTKPAFSRSVVTRMEDIEGGTARLRTTWLQGCDHSILARTFLLKQLYEWLFCHSLADEGRPVNQDIDIVPNDLNVAYTRLDPKKARTLPIQKP